MRTLCISDHPPIYPRLHSWAKALPMLRPISRKLEARLQFRQNARTADYMDQAASRHLGDFTTVTAANLHLVDWNGFDRVVLLWADGNGLGWGPLENRVRALVTPSAEFMVLNGRQRLFRFSGFTHRRLRRFLEKTGAADIAAALAFIVGTPFLLAFDFARGKR